MRLFDKANFSVLFFLIQKRKEKSLNSGLAVIDNFSREFLQGDANFYISKMQNPSSTLRYGEMCVLFLNLVSLSRIEIINDILVAFMN